MATMKRCRNRIPEAMAGNVQPHQRPQCDREYDPSLGDSHGGKCKATRRHKNAEGKHVGHTEWQWYADRVQPSARDIALGPKDRYRDVMTRARLANGGRGATAAQTPPGPFTRAVDRVKCTCPDEAMGMIAHVSGCKLAGLLR